LISALVISTSLIFHFDAYIGYNSQCRRL